MGKLSMRVFQMLSAGNIGQPAKVGEALGWAWLASCASSSARARKGRGMSDFIE